MRFDGGLDEGERKGEIRMMIIFLGWVIFWMVLFFKMEKFGGGLGLGWEVN